MNDGEAANFGLDQHMEHDERYDHADEFLQLTVELWDSSEPGALVLDRECGIYAEPDKVHHVGHAGRYFRARAPPEHPVPPAGPAGDRPGGLLVARPLVRCQAGGSDLQPGAVRGCHGVVHRLDPPSGRRHRAPVEDCRVLPAVMPLIASSEAEAIEKRDAHNALVNPLAGLCTLSGHANVDLSTRPLDVQVEDLKSRGKQGNIAHVSRLAKDKAMTLAEVGRASGQSVLVPQLVGTGARIADQLADIFRSDACDGFVISPAFGLPDPTVAQNIRLGGHVRRHERRFVAMRTETVLDLFPRLRERHDQVADTLSGGCCRSRWP